MEMTAEEAEAKLWSLKLNEHVTIDGNRYQRTIGGWIFSNYSGTALCFIPDTDKAEIKDEMKPVRQRVVKK